MERFTRGYNMMGNRSPFLLEIGVVRETVKPAQHWCKQGIGFLKPFNRVEVIFHLRKLMWFSHPRLQHLVKIIPWLISFNEIIIKEFPKRFESIIFYKILRTKIGKKQSCTIIKRTIFWIVMVNNPFDCIVVREDGRSCSNHVDAEIPNSLINGLVILKVWKIIVVKNGIYSGPI